MASLAQRYVTWYTTLNRTMGSKLEAQMLQKFGPGNFYGAVVDSSGKYAKLNNVFQCPEAVASGIEQQVSYYNNPVVMTHSAMEGKGFGTSAFVSGPLKQTKVYAETAMFWDTPCLSGLSDYYGLPFFHQEEMASPSAAGVDGTLDLPVRLPTFRRFQYPVLRFRNGPKDELESFTAQGYSIYQSIWLTVDEEIPRIAGFNTTLNADMPFDRFWTVSIGNVRFRHQKNVAANVAFADGSVRSFKLNKQRTYKGVGGTSYDTELKRYMFMPRNPGVTGPKFTGSGNG